MPSDEDNNADFTQVITGLFLRLVEEDHGKSKMQCLVMSKVKGQGHMCKVKPFSRSHLTHASPMQLLLIHLNHNVHVTKISLEFRRN